MAENDSNQEENKDSGNEEQAPKLSKRALKKLKKRQEWLSTKKERKTLEKEKRKEKMAKRKAENPDLESYSTSRKRIKNSYEQKTKSDIHVVFDMSFGDKMNQRDRGKCLKQLLHCYSLNRRLDMPLNLHISNFNGIMKTDMVERYQGFEKWDVKFHDKCHSQVFGTGQENADCKSKEDIVYLSSDSENVIETLLPQKVYIIGALVDHNLHKGLCLSQAKKMGLSHGRLPIDEYVKLNSRKVLTIDHVFQIMGSVASQKESWSDAFLSILPQRKGVEVLKKASQTSIEGPTNSIGLKSAEIN